MALGGTITFPAVRTLSSRTSWVKVAHVLVFRAEDDVFRGAYLDHAAILHDGDAVAQLEGLVEVVRDENDGLVQLFLEPQQLVLHLAAD